jgi:hypothetical protein
MSRRHEHSYRQYLRTKTVPERQLKDGTPKREHGDHFSDNFLISVIFVIACQKFITVISIGFTDSEVLFGIPLKSLEIFL